MGWWWMDQRPRRMGRRWWLVESRRRRRRLGKPSVLWWRRCMGQSVVSDSSMRGGVSPEPDGSIPFLPAALAEEQDGRPFVAIVRGRDEFLRLLDKPPVGLQWLQVEGLLGEPDAWGQAAYGDLDVAFYIFLTAAWAKFSDLYRLVDVCAARNVRVSMPALPGFSKAVRLAAALRLPVRILPG